MIRCRGRVGVRLSWSGRVVWPIRGLKGDAAA